MAELTGIKSYMSLQCDTGEVVNGKSIKRTINITGLMTDSEAAALNTVAKKIGVLLRWTPRSATYTNVFAVEAN